MFERVKMVQATHPDHLVGTVCDSSQTNREASEPEV